MIISPDEMQALLMSDCFEIGDKVKLIRGVADMGIGEVISVMDGRLVDVMFTTGKYMFERGFLRHVFER